MEKPAQILGSLIFHFIVSGNNSYPSRWQHPNVGIELKVVHLFFNGRVYVILKVIIIYQSGFVVAVRPLVRRKFQLPCRMIYLLVEEKLKFLLRKDHILANI